MRERERERVSEIKMMLEQVRGIIPFLEKSLNARILDYSAVPLTAQGDNFGSTILAINVKVKFNAINDALGEVCMILFIPLLFVFRFISNHKFFKNASFVVGENN